MNVRPEPRRLSGWITPLAAAMVTIGTLAGTWWLGAIGAALSTAWLVQRFRWVNWDMDRRAAAMREAQKGRHDER